MEILGIHLWKFNRVSQLSKRKISGRKWENFSHLKKTGRKKCCTRKIATHLWFLMVLGFLMGLKGSRFGGGNWTTPLYLWMRQCLIKIIRDKTWEELGKTHSSQFTITSWYPSKQLPWDAQVFRQGGQGGITSIIWGSTAQISKIMV